MKRCRMREAGIVDQDVEAAEIRDDVVDHDFDGGKIGHVGLDRLSPCRRFAVISATNDFRFLGGDAVVDGNARRPRRRG